MLACTADGGKLPPYVIFKRKTLPKGAMWPKGIIVRCQEKGWMDETLMKDWMKHVWGNSHQEKFISSGCLPMPQVRSYQGPAKDGLPNHSGHNSWWYDIDAPALRCQHQQADENDAQKEME